MHQTETENHKTSEAVSRDRITAFVALGANLGDARAALHWAVREFDGLPLTRVSQASGVYLTAPMNNGDGNEGSASGPDYFNAVVSLETGLTAPALLEQLQMLEQKAGRKRPYRNAPRTLDLDLLLYGSARIESARLCVPHPRMMQRAFVLLPLAEIAPGLVSGCALEAVGRQIIMRLKDLEI